MSRACKYYTGFYTLDTEQINLKNRTITAAKRPFLDVRRKNFLVLGNEKK